MAALRPPTHLSGIASRPRWQSGLSTLVSAAWDFVFPRSCPWCACAIVDAGEAEGNLGSVLCARCAAAIAIPVESPCPRCAAPVGPFLNATGCVHCRRARFKFERVMAIGVYDELLHAACLRAKNAYAAPLASALGGLLWKRQGALLAASAFDCVVPVPSHWTKRLTGGHNAAETIARVLARRLRVPFAGHILRKTRWTPPQSSLPPTSRATNLRGAFFSGRVPQLANRSVLLVDDVLTTGNTANEATRALLRGGARSVTVAVLARGLGRRSASASPSSVPGTERTL